MQRIHTDVPLFASICLLNTCMVFLKHLTCDYIARQRVLSYTTEKRTVTNLKYSYVFLTSHMVFEKSHRFPTTGLELHCLFRFSCLDSFVHAITHMSVTRNTGKIIQLN